MECPKCRHKNPSEAKFCLECGTKLEKVCPKCGTKLPDETKFCLECGTNVGAQHAAPKGTRHAVPLLEEMQSRLFIPQPLKERMEAVAQQLEGQNRLVTVMFADISGFTPASEKLSPEQVAELANECFKAIVNSIVKYEGSINRFIGDSALAFFGAPISHENDPERAILAALDIIQAMQKLNRQVTIGINTGLVYLGSVGVEAHQEYTVEGHAANLAKRLQEAAKPGEIIVGEGTYRLTRRTFEFEPLSPLTLKGISKPVIAYKALRILPKPEKIRGIEGLKAEMIGRDREFAELKECLDELINGRGQIVSIIGEAGVGKSRLVSELKAYLGGFSPHPLIPSSPHQSLWLEGRCVSIGESIGYWVFIDILRSYLEVSAEDSPSDIADKIVNKMKSLFPQRWEDVVPYVGNLLSVKFGNQWDDKVKYLPAEQIKHQIFLTLRDVFLALANQKPLLLILEDLHWADNLSLDLLSLLMDELSLAPLMILCVYRPEKEHKSWHISTIASSKCLDRYKEITLRPLSPQEGRRLVEALLRIENLPEGIKETILRKSEGNPFFVEEVIRSLIESGVVYKEGERWFAKSEIGELSVPDTIQNVIMARIDKLEEEVKYVLQSAAVIGRLFRHKLLQYTTQQERNLDRYLWQLEERELVYEERAIPELEYSFKHALTQETAYNTILSRRRREFHRKVGEGYEALYSSRMEEYYEELAYHYSRSDDQEKALHYLVKAGDKLKEAFLNEQAIEYYHQALKLIDNVGALLAAPHAAPLRGHIYQSLGEIYFPMAKHQEALEYCRQALEHTTDKKKRARIYQIMGWMYVREESKLDLALEHLNLGIAELGADTESPEMARLCIPLFWVRNDKGDGEEAIEIALRGLKIVEGTDHYFEIEELCTCLLWVYAHPMYRLNDIDKAFEYARKSVEVAQKSGNSYLIAHSTFWLGWVHMQKGEDDTAIKLMKEAMDIYKKIGYNFGIGQAYRWLSEIYWKRVDWDGVIDCLQRRLEISTYHGTSISQSISQLAFAYLQKGDSEKAIEYFKKALEVGISDSMGVAQNLGTMEEAFVKMGKREEFISFCQKFKEEKKGEIGNLKLTQWYLEPVDVGAQQAAPLQSTTFADEFDQPALKSEWEWINPREDSSYSLSSEAGWLEIHAAPQSYLYRSYGTKFEAPRLLWEIPGDSGDFAAEIKMKAASDDLPSIGGLLIWKDKENYVQFQRGREGGIRFSGMINGEFDDFGRGMLGSEVIYLRLEKIGDRISAYCSQDGENWLTCGELGAQQAAPLQNDPIQVGIYAIGQDTETATRFDYFRVMR